MRDANKAMGGQAVAAMALLGAGSGVSSPTTNYMELMKSRTVLEPIIDAMDWDDPEKKPDAKAFAKSYLDIKNTKSTNLIEVTAKGKKPEEAQQVSQSVVDNFLAMQTNNQQQTQSLLVKFLNDRIEDAKKTLMKPRRNSPTTSANIKCTAKMKKPKRPSKNLMAMMKRKS